MRSYLWMNKIRYILVLFFLLTGNHLFANWTNILYNYSRTDYNAGSQNWQIIQQNNNWMYFANKSGVLEFNGNDWKLYMLNNRSDVRAIEHSKDRIYVGGLNEFGYFKTEKNGKLTYVCMSDSLLPDQLFFGNIWQIYEAGQILYFVADNVVIRYADGKHSVITTPEKVHTSKIINDILYLGTASGIYVSVGDKFYFLAHSEKLKNKKIRSLCPFNDKILVATASEGLFILDEKEISVFETEVDDFIRKNEIFSMSVNEHYIALGTVLKGLVVTDREGKALKYMNEANGLQNNTVLSILFDKDENIWLGLDNGITYVMLNSPLTNLYSSKNFYGAGYGAILDRNIMYLATNRGLYYTKWPMPITDAPTKLNLIEGSQGQIWSIDKIGDDLFCSADKGLFLIRGTDLLPVDRKTGVWSIRQMMGDSTRIWASTYDGFYIFQKVSGLWVKQSYVYGYPGSGINYAEESPKNMWIRTGREEILRITVNDALDKVDKNKHFTPADKAPRDAYIYKIDNKLLFCSPGGIYEYDGENFKIDEKYNVRGRNFTSVVKRNDVMWYLGPSYIQKNTKDSTILYAHNLPMINDFERLIFLNDSDVIICNENGFALWNSAYNNQSRLHETMSINKVSISKTGDSLIYTGNFAGEKYIPEIEYKYNTIRFRYGLMSFSKHTEATYRFRLNDEDWSEPTTAVIKEYSNLREGKYTFRVEASLENGTKLTDEFTLVILPPWYRTTAVFIIYGILFICFLIAVWRWDDLRIKKKKKQIEAAKQKEIQEKEQVFKEETEKKEQEIVQLKNEHLELEIKHKNQELANIAINLVGKNDILTEIKADLSKLSRELKSVEKTMPLRRNILLLSSKIDENINQDDNLKKFEEHFDLVHNNFMQKLSEKYPDLSLNERKMCAFIKMQLSSKEMAPLLNISLRGLETLRYRLRKKFDLTRDESLTGFLNQI